VVGGGGEVEDLVGAQDVQPGALGLDGGRDGREVVGPHRGADDWAAVAVAQPDGLRAAHGQRLDGCRRGPVHPQVREVVRVAAVRHPGHRGAPALRGQADPGVVQGGSAAQRREPGVGVKAAVELVAGVVHDPLFGLLVMLGLGGVNTDLFAYRVLRLLPVNTDAAAMWRSLRTAPLGRGGTAPAAGSPRRNPARGRRARPQPDPRRIRRGSPRSTSSCGSHRSPPSPTRRYGNCANPDEPARRHGEASGGAARRSDRPPGRGGGLHCRRSPRVGGSSGRPWRVIVRTAARTGRADASGWTGAGRRRPR
jgi:hypothetical protein